MFFFFVENQSFNQKRKFRKFNGNLLISQIKLINTPEYNIYMYTKKKKRKAYETTRDE